MNKKVFIILLTIISVIVLISIVFFQKHSKNEKTNEEKVDYTYELFSPKIESSIDQCMMWMNGIYYKQLDTYSNYNEFKSNILNMPDLNESDFKDNFVIITIQGSQQTNRLILNELYTENNTLYVGLIKSPDNEDFNENNKGICIKINNKMKKENIDVYKTILNKNFITKYDDIRKLPVDYSIEKAVSDGCIVNYDDENSKKSVTLNREVFNNFKDSIKNNNDDEVRFLCVQDEKKIVFDLKYSNQEKKFYFCLDDSRNSNRTYNYFEFTDLNEIISTDEYTTYKLSNKNTNDEYDFFIMTN